MIDAASVSVVVPAYQAAWSIGDTVRSVLQQSWPVRELIIVNDGSTDDLAVAVAEASQGDPRVIILDQENQGLAGARNRGLTAATGDLVAFIDADDIWHPQFIELVGEVLGSNPSAPFAYAYSFRFDRYNRARLTAPVRRVPRHDFIGLLTLNSVGNGSAALFRRDLLLSLGGFDEGPTRDREHGAEDWKLVLQLAAHGQPVILPLPLVGYRWAEGGMSQSAPLRQLRAVRRVISEVRSSHPKVPARHFADAGTMMAGWLLPAIIRTEGMASALRLILGAYVRNPGWIRSADLRELHVRKIRELAASALSRLVPSLRPRPLCEIHIDGARPFAYLANSQTPRPPGGLPSIDPERDSTVDRPRAMATKCR